MQNSETDAYAQRTRAVDLVLAMMASATTEKIRPVDWWPRAKGALVAACNRAENWAQLISTMARKLQIETLRADSGKAISACEPPPDEFAAFARIARREAVYIVAQAQVIRDQQRKDQEARA